MMATYPGEAPETDSEDEQYLFNLSYMKVCIGPRNISKNTEIGQ